MPRRVGSVRLRRRRALSTNNDVMWILSLGKGYLPALQRTVLKKSMVVLSLRLVKRNALYLLAAAALEKAGHMLAVVKTLARRKNRTI